MKKNGIEKKVPARKSIGAGSQSLLASVNDVTVDFLPARFP
jgi:hypothetical protein